MRFDRLYMMKVSLLLFVEISLIFFLFRNPFSKGFLRKYRLNRFDDSSFLFFVLNTTV